MEKRRRGRTQAVSAAKARLLRYISFAIALAGTNKTLTTLAIAHAMLFITCPRSLARERGYGASTALLSS